MGYNFGFNSFLLNFLEKAFILKYLIQENLQENYSVHDFNKWFKPLDLYYDEKDTKLTVYFPHSFFEPWFVEQGKKLFEQAVQKVSMQKFGFVPSIEYSINSPAPKKPQNLYTSFLQNNKKININKTFANFFYNKKNEFVLETAKEISKKTSIPKYNPFIMYGKSSTGKTHILNAMHENLSISHTDIFMGSIEELDKNISSLSIESFVAKFSVFIIDNLQYMNISDEFQQKFVQFIDFCTIENKQIILASSIYFTANKNYKEYLKSRLNMGLTVKLSNADIDVRMRFAVFFCNEQNIKISKNQLLAITQRCRNISLLKGVLLKIKAFLDVSLKDISDSDIKNIFSSLGEEKRSISPQDIINITAKYFDIDKKLILKDVRQPHIVKARQMSMHLCRDLLGLSYPSIGKIFGGKDHSTVMYSIKKINLLIVKNKDMQNAVTKIKQKCGSI